MKREFWLKKKKKVEYRNAVHEFAGLFSLLLGVTWHLSALTPSLPLPCTLLVVVSSVNCLPSRMVSWVHGSAVLAQSGPAFVQSLEGGPSAVLHLFSHLTALASRQQVPQTLCPFPLRSFQTWIDFRRAALKN